MRRIFRSFSWKVSRSCLCGQRERLHPRDGSSGRLLYNLPLGLCVSQFEGRLISSRVISLSVEFSPEFSPMRSIRLTLFLCVKFKGVFIIKENRCTYSFYLNEMLLNVFFLIKKLNII